MADEINDLRLLVQLVASGSVTNASIALNSSPPAVSRRLAAMENRLGVRLLDRHARRFRLTEEGGVLYERAQAIIAEVEDAEAEISAEQSAPRGKLRISAPTHIGHTRIAPVVAAFAAEYRQVTVELVLTDAEIDLAEDEIDLALNIGQPTAQSVVARPLVPSRRILCASPDYLKRMGLPETPDDLVKHECLLLVRGRKIFDRWLFRDGDMLHELRVRGRMLTTSSDVIHQWALAGHGIGLKALWDVHGDLASGRLIECLPSYANTEAVDLYIVYAHRKHLPLRVRVFVDYLIRCIAQCQQSDTA